MNLLDRVKAAYAGVDALAPDLALGNDHTSGYKLVAKAALVSVMNLSSPDEAADYAERLATELRHAPTGR